MLNSKHCTKAAWQTINISYLPTGSCSKCTELVTFKKNLFFFQATGSYIILSTISKTDKLDKNIKKEKLQPQDIHIKLVLSQNNTHKDLSFFYQKIYDGMNKKLDMRCSICVLLASDQFNKLTYTAFLQVYD